ncbi:MAG: carboxypeptidase regulatory-like domain-containing protein [Acidobacteriota bacterium]|nr:carboxypeptidase regulatory-like domain-containing protein [Acidobacteriota bacterium]
MMKFSRARIVRQVATLAAILSLPNIVPAQITTATLTGTITDSTGAAVAGAGIVVTNTETAQARATTSDAHGGYVIASLPNGVYRAKVTAPTFKTAVSDGIVLKVGTSSVIDFSLSVGAVAEAVTVNGTESQVATTSAELAMVVDQTQIRDIPLNGRNFEQLILLAPGVQPVASSGKAAFLGRNDTYSISGARNEGQAILLDGTDIQGYWQHGSGAGTVGTSLGVEAVQEFQTLVGIYGAQFGGNGSAINSVTKSGSNVTHGSVYDYFRNSALDSRNFFDQPSLKKPGFKRNQFGGTLGGPIRKDRLFFFTNYEGLRQSLNETYVAILPDANAHNGDVPCNPSQGLPCNSKGLTHVGVSPSMQSLLNLLPIPAASASSGGLGSYFSVGSQPATENYTNSRLDFTPSEKDSLFLRYVYDQAQLVDPFAVSAVLGFSQTSTNANHYLTLEERHLATSNLINLVRASYVRLNGAAPRITGQPALAFYTGGALGQVQIPGGSQVGGGLFGGFRQIQNKYTFSDEIYYASHRHSIKVGASVARVQTASNLDFLAGGYYLFPGLAQFLLAQPFFYEGPQLNSSSLPEDYGTRYFRELNYAFYVQDDWKLNDRLTVNIGVRYAPGSNPTSPVNNLHQIVDPPNGDGSITLVQHPFASNPELKNIDPRVGFSYDPFGNHKTAIRGGFGTYHEPYAARTYGPSFNLTDPYNLSTQVSIPGAGMPPIAYGHPFQGLANGGAGQVSVVNALSYQTRTTPYMMQYSIGLERQIADQTVLGATFVGNRGIHLGVQRNLNPPVRTLNSSGVYVMANSNNRLNNNYGTLDYIVPGATSDYKGLQTYLHRNLTRSLQAQLNYTFSRCNDDASASTAGEALNGTLDQTDPYNIHADDGPCTFDIHHNVSGNVIYLLPFKSNRLAAGWSLSGAVFANSGQPFSVYDSYDQANLGDGQGYSRPNLVGDPTRGGTVAGNSGCAAPATVHTASYWYNPCAFALQTAGTLGNEQRNRLAGPHFADFDLALLKETKVSEHVSAQFRAEGFNVLNHPNFALPNLAGFSDFTGVPNSAAGQITATVTNSRQVQLALKVRF